MDNVSENKDYKRTLKSDTLAKQWRFNVTQKGKLKSQEDALVLNFYQKITKIN